LVLTCPTTVSAATRPAVCTSFFSSAQLLRRRGSYDSA